jgi:integrase
LHLLETGVQAIQLSPYRADPPARRPIRLGTTAGFLACCFPGSPFRGQVSHQIQRHLLSSLPAARAIQQCASWRTKGRKDRATPLTPHTVQVLTAWLAEQHAGPAGPLFATQAGAPLSRDAVEHLVTRHAATAARACPSLQPKKITPHTLRHTTAMNLLHAGVDITVIALWLGHEAPSTTRIYLHADMALKEKAIARTTPPDTQPGRYQPPDELLAFLSRL